MSFIRAVFFPVHLFFSFHVLFCSNYDIAISTGLKLKTLDADVAHPIFELSYEVSEFIEGSSAYLYCNASGENISYSWFNEENQELTAYQYEDGSLLTFPKVTIHDAGSYTCIAENAQGLASKIFVMNIKECDCGSNSKKCKIYEGKKLCECLENYVQENDLCKPNPCLENKNYCSDKPDTICSFNESSNAMYCRCYNFKLRYDSWKNKCKLPCADWTTCENDNPCIDGFCRCELDLTGDLCEDVIDCMPGGLLANCGGQCTYSVTQRKAVCKCGGGQVFDQLERKCKSRLDCSSCIFGYCIQTHDSFICSCDDGYEGLYCEKQVSRNSTFVYLLMSFVSIFILLILFSVIFYLKTRRLQKK